MEVKGVKGYCGEGRGRGRGRREDDWRQRGWVLAYGSDELGGQRVTKEGVGGHAACRRQEVGRWGGDTGQWAKLLAVSGKEAWRTRAEAVEGKGKATLQWRQKGNRTPRPVLPTSGGEGTQRR